MIGDRLRRLAALSTLGVYLLAILEVAVMSTPFAAYYYAAYSPVLGLLQRSAYSGWLSAFFVTHLSEPDSAFLAGFVVFGRVLAYGGLSLFVVHAIYLYWMKFGRRAVASKMLYAFVRHPQYACLMVAGLGFAIMWPRFVNLILFMAMSAAYFVLVRVEERWMLARHGAGYRDYAEGKPMFLPGNPGGRLVRALFGWAPAGRMRGSLVATAVFTSVMASSCGLRAYSVASLRTYRPVTSPNTLVIALDPPAAAELDDVASRAARAVASTEGAGGSSTLVYLIWDAKLLRHFLIDAGVRRDVFEEIEIPEARVFVVAASIRAFGAADRRVRVDAPEAALGMRCLRRLEGIRYQTAESEDWHEFRLPDDAVLGHASLPAL
ncbi:MAG: methyltransferase [Planctomycetota bacterium]|nr:methyltransferase [Planctomycetota bacterium]